MKADIFVLYCCGVIAALFAYVFVGGLVVRVWNACPFASDKVEEEGARMMVAVMWPVVILMLFCLCFVQLLGCAFRLSQWRPRRKSQLPGARAVKS